MKLIVVSSITILLLLLANIWNSYKVIPVCKVFNK